MIQFFRELPILGVIGLCILFGLVVSGLVLLFSPITETFEEEEDEG